jgi:preprotein translocase subunit SecF
MQIFKSANFNFVGNRNKAFIFSGVLILAGVVSLIIHKGPNFSIDFLGGTVIQLKFEKPVAQDLGTIRSIVSSLGFGTPEVKTIGQMADNEIQVLVKRQAESSMVGEQIRAVLTKEYAANPYELQREELVGPKIGSEMQVSAFMAIGLSLIAIIIYIAIRFNLPFGVAAVLALAHDTIITIGAFSVLNYEISLPIIAALLTIIGYSLNDTIVVFDRIRENLADSLSRKSFEDKCNSSINQTLSRTIITSGTTLAAILILYLAFFFTADVIKDFAFAMLVGVGIGTYSSIFVATPVVILWNKKWPLR